MIDFKTFLETYKEEESSNINRIAKNFFLDKLPFSYAVRLLDKEDLKVVTALQKTFSKKGTLRQNTKKKLLESLEKGVWIGVFNNEEELEAYTVFELEFFEDNVLLYLKATAKREDSTLKGFQRQSLKLRKKIGGDLAEKSLIPFAGGYATCHRNNQLSISNIEQSGMYRLFHVKGLYGKSPKGDRDIFGYGDIFDLKDLLFEKWDALDIQE